MVAYPRRTESDIDILPSVDKCSIDITSLMPVFDGLLDIETLNAQFGMSMDNLLVHKIAISQNWEVDILTVNIVGQVGIRLHLSRSLHDAAHTVRSIQPSRCEICVCLETNYALNKSHLPDRYKGASN